MDRPIVAFWQNNLREGDFDLAAVISRLCDAVHTLIGPFALTDFGVASGSFLGDALSVWSTDHPDVPVIPKPRTDDAIWWDVEVLWGHEEAVRAGLTRLMGHRSQSSRVFIALALDGRGWPTFVDTNAMGFCLHQARWALTQALANGGAI